MLSAECWVLSSNLVRNFGPALAFSSLVRRNRTGTAVYEDIFWRECSLLQFISATGDTAAKRNSPGAFLTC
jgi:hypothetical protein